MRALVMIFLAWISMAGLPGSQASARSLPMVGGQEYVMLESWAEANHFQFAGLKKEKDEEVQLTSPSSKLLFKLNSQRAEINGVTVFLAFPIVVHQGAVCIAQRDIDRSLKPILFPAKNVPRRPVKVVALAAGHGGKDSGYRVGGQEEKKYTLLLTKEVQRLISRAGFKPVLLRNSDKLVEIDDRARLAKQSKADVYVELHYNSAGAVNNEIRGAEVYCLTLAGANSTNGGSDQYGGSLPGNRHDENNVLLAYQIHHALVDNAGMADRGVRRARFEVLRDAEMPAVLIEAGFMSHPQEMRDIQNSARRRQTAQAILDGLLAYKRLVER